MKRLLFIITGILISISLYPAEPAREDKLTILFVGNSYTYVNNMPGILEAMIDSTRCDTVWITQVDIMSITRGGYTLKRHWEENKSQIEDSLKLAKRNRSSIVLVIQEQSQGALTPASRDMLTEYAKLFAGLGKEYDARIVVYQTWGRRVTSTRYGEPRRSIPHFMYQAVVQGDTIALDETVTSANKGICRTYRRLADSVGADVAPCGEAFAEAIRQGVFVHRINEPYGSHPNPIGSYLVASVMFGTIFDISPLYIPSGVYQYVWPALAGRMHMIAEGAVNGRLDP